MKRSSLRHDPTRLLDRGESLAGAVLRAAGELTPPEGARERIWLRLTEGALESARYPRLIHDRPEEPLQSVLRRASGDEPSPGTEERIWRRLAEESRARNGVADPPRLLESYPILSRAANLEPPFGRRTRILHAVTPPRRSRFVYATAGFSLAAAAALVLVVNLPKTRPAALPVTAGNDLRVVHASSDVPPNQLAVGDSVELSGAASARWQLAGVGDCVLDGAEARVTLAENDHHGVRLDLDRGRIAIHAAKRSHTAPLIVHSHGVDVEVVGTILAVDSNPAGVQVFVREGRVQVRAPGQQPVYVSAGEHWPSTIATANWAATDMGTLAGVTVVTSAAPVAVQAPPAVRTAVQPEQLAIEETTPVEKPVAALDRHRARPTRSSTPAESALALTPDTAPVALHVGPGQPYDDLDNDAEYYENNIAADKLQRMIASSQKNGDAAELAAMYRALAQKPDASPSAQRWAALALFTLLDDKLAAPGAAVKYRHDLRSSLDHADLGASDMTMLADTYEMGLTQDALDKADVCVQECTADQTSIALVLKARLLADAGEVERVQALRSAGLKASDYPRAAVYFAARALHFEQEGQRRRARVDAELSLSLDSHSAQAPALQSILR